MKTMILYCVFSKESILRMGGNRGKLVAQAGHAFLHSYFEAQEKFPNDVVEYRQGLARKVCLVCETDEQMLKVLEDHQNICATTKVIDRGLTVFKEPTLTCIGIGPINKEDALDSLKNLSVLI